MITEKAPKMQKKTMLDKKWGRPLPPFDSPKTPLTRENTLRNRSKPHLFGQRTSASQRALWHAKSSASFGKYEKKDDSVQRDPTPSWPSWFFWENLPVGPMTYFTPKNAEVFTSIAFVWEFSHIAGVRKPFFWGHMGWVAERRSQEKLGFC